MAMLYLAQQTKLFGRLDAPQVRLGLVRDIYEENIVLASSWEFHFTINQKNKLTQQIIKQFTWYWVSFQKKFTFMHGKWNSFLNNIGYTKRYNTYMIYDLLPTSFHTLDALEKL